MTVRKLSEVIEVCPRVIIRTGLDAILRGGLPADRLYLLEGAPGSGKTTLSLQFLREGVRRGERALYITLSETREELAIVAASHGWDIDEFDVRGEHELSIAAKREFRKHALLDAVGRKFRHFGEHPNPRQVQDDGDFGRGIDRGSG